MISARDEERHPVGPGELWNESYYFNFYDGQTRTGGFTRIGLEDNRKRSNIWCLLIKDGRPSYQRFLLNLPHTEAGFKKGITVEGLTLRMLEPLKKFKVEFKDGATEIDLLWQGFHPIKHFGESGEGLPENMATGHYEQSGLVTGTFALKGETFDFHGTGARDHSWGIRDWGALKGWMGSWPVFGKEGLFTFTCGRITLADGTVRKLGFVFDGRENLEIVDSEMKAEFAGDGFTPKRVQLDLTDEKGNRVKVAGKRIANFPLPYDNNILNEAMFEYRMGHRTGYGLFEYFVSP
jgi:hypothetical protein